MTSCRIVFAFTCVFFASVSSVPIGAAEPQVTTDVVYGHKYGLAMTFDIFHPEKKNGATVLFMVSGGWYSHWAPPRAVRGFFGYLLEKGFTVCAVRHGSSPKFKIPEIVEDVRRAVRFIRANAARYDIDADRIGVLGGSAGGHLALLLGTASDDGDSKAKDPVDRVSSRVAAVVALFPPVDLRGMTCEVGEDGELTGGSERFPALNFHPDKADDYSPIDHVTKDDPPTLLIHGDRDRLVPVRHSKRMHRALESAGVETDLFVVEGAGHGFGGDDRREVERRSAAWFLEHLAAEEAGQPGDAEAKPPQEAPEEKRQTDGAGERP